MAVTVATLRRDVERLRRLCAATATSSATPTVSLPEEFPHQAAVLSHPARMKVVICGRRWGKTALGLLAVINGHGGGKGALGGARIWWVAPSHPIASAIWRDLKAACRDAWTHKDEVQWRIELPGGGSVTVRSAIDPESLVAEGLDGLVVDEAARVRKEAWDFLRPTLADRQGWAIFITTPKGFNWVHDLFEYA